MTFSYTPGTMAEQKTGSEGRQHARAPIELKVDYKKLNSFFADYRRTSRRVAPSSRRRRPLPIGTRFLFKLTVPQREAPFELLGEGGLVQGGRGGARHGHPLHLQR
jgi:type IV pilus assembly protein PilZ